MNAYYCIIMIRYAILPLKDWIRNQSTQNVWHTFLSILFRLLNQSVLKQHSVRQFIIFCFGFQAQLPDCFRLYLTYSNNYVNLIEEGNCFLHWNDEKQFVDQMTCNIHKIIEITTARLCTLRLSFSRQVHRKITINIDFSAQLLTCHYISIHETLLSAMLYFNASEN